MILRPQPLPSSGCRYGPRGGCGGDSIRCGWGEWDGCGCWAAARAVEGTQLAAAQVSPAVAAPVAVSAVPEVPALTVMAVGVWMGLGLGADPGRSCVLMAPGRSADGYCRSGPANAGHATGPRVPLGPTCFRCGYRDDPRPNNTAHCAVPLSSVDAPFVLLVTAS